MFFRLHITHEKNVKKKGEYVMFREMKNLNIPYKRQGLIYFTCLNYDTLEEKQQERIIQTCIKTSPEHYQSLFKYLTADTTEYAPWRIERDLCISPNTLHRLKRQFYKNWDSDFKKKLYNA